MRKFLIVLMIVALASFLFVGCNGVTPPIENNPPEITTSAVTSAKVGVAYTYDVNATDPEGDTLTYSLTEKPLGMSIVATTGVISWIPTDAGLFTVDVKVSDPDGLFDSQSFGITVATADEPEPELPSVPPVIFDIDYIDLYSSDTQYINEDEADDGIFVRGFAPKYSEIKIYIDGEVVGTGYAYGLLEHFKVFVTKTKLGEDGEKVLCATATEFGLVESADSTAYTFILDTVAPEIVKIVAEGEDLTPGGPGTPIGDGTVTITFDEELDEDNLGTWTIKNFTSVVPDVVDPPAELISPKVVELEVDFTFPGQSYAGDILRVSCENITDLAGNEVDDFGYCWLMPSE